MAGIKNVDTVIPGHSAVIDWQDFVEFGEFTRAFLTAVQAAKKAGKTAEQAAAELTLPDKFKAYVMTRAKDNVATIYKQLPVSRAAYPWRPPRWRPPAAACSSTGGARRPGAAAAPPADAAAPEPRRPARRPLAAQGGMVLMNGDIHYEVVFSRDGRHRVWFSDPCAHELPASVATGVTMTITRDGEPAEVLALAIDDTGESWVAAGPSGEGRRLREGRLRVAGRAARSGAAVRDPGAADAVGGVDTLSVGAA